MGKPGWLRFAAIFSLFFLCFGRVKIAPPDLAFYYSFAHSLVYDLDFCFADEFSHFPFAFHETALTSLGYPANDWPMGAGIGWIPFLLAARAVKGIAVVAGFATDNGGYGWFEQWVVTLGATLLYGCGTLWLSYRICRREGIAKSAALWATFFIGFGSSFTYHLYVNSADSHPPSAFFIALFLLLYQKQKESPTLGHGFLAGCAIGMAGLVRPHNLIFFMIPLTDRLSRRRIGTERPSEFAPLGFMLFGAALVFFPQSLVWKTLYGFWSTIPRTEEVLWMQPKLFEMLFSDFHGMISWSPLFGLGFLGLFTRRKWFLWSIPVLLQIYIYACNLAWWAGGSFGNRRMVGCAPLFILGLAGLLEAIPRIWLKILAIVCGLWTQSLLIAEVGGMIQLDHYQPWSEIINAVRSGLRAGILAFFPVSDWNRHGLERMAGYLTVLALAGGGYFLWNKIQRFRPLSSPKIIAGIVLFFNAICIAAAIRSPAALRQADVSEYSRHDRFAWVVYFEGGFYEAKRGHFPEALEIFLAATLAEPRHPQPWMYSAFLCEEFQWDIPAYHLAKQALMAGQRTPDFMDFFQKLLTTLIQTQRFSLPLIYNERGVLYALRGRYDSAKEDFQAAIAVDGNYKPAAENLQILEERRSGKSKPFHWE